MIATFKSCKLSGTVEAPPSKSMAHRYLIGAALSKQPCVLSGVDYSEDILASIDCLKALGTDVTIEKDKVSIDPKGFMKVDNPMLECRESGSTLRFFIPLALCLGKTVVLKGSQRLLERPLGLYEELCHEKGFVFQKEANGITVCGKLESGNYKLRGDISSQFITGLIFALLYLGKDSSIEIIPPFESRSYINLTISALKSFGANIEFTEEYKIEIKQSQLHSFSGKIEGDYSNAAFLDAFNYLDGNVLVKGLNSSSLQGDKAYIDYFKNILKSRYDKYEKSVSSSRVQASSFKNDNFQDGMYCEMKKRLHKVATKVSYLKRHNLKKEILTVIKSADANVEHAFQFYGKDYIKERKAHKKDRDSYITSLDEIRKDLEEFNGNSIQTTNQVVLENSEKSL